MVVVADLKTEVVVVVVVVVVGVVVAVVYVRSADTRERVLGHLNSRTVIMEVEIR